LATLRLTAVNTVVRRCHRVISAAWMRISTVSHSTSKHVSLSDGKTTLLLLIIRFSQIPITRRASPPVASQYEEGCWKDPIWILFSVLRSFHSALFWIWICAFTLRRDSDYI